MATTLQIFPSLRGEGFPIPRRQKWNTPKADALSGKRTRYPNWTYPQYEYEVPINFLRSKLGFTEWQQFEGFFAAVLGDGLLWAYDDPNDDSVANQSIGVGDGVSTTFQLVRTLGGFTAPVFLTNGAPSFTVNGVPTAGTVSAYGQVTFAVAPAVGATLAWVGGNAPDFYMPCRFDEEMVEFVNFASGFFSIKSLKFSTEKLP
jgi:hypothetical protein